MCHFLLLDIFSYLSLCLSLIPPPTSLSLFFCSFSPSSSLSFISWLIPKSFWNSLFLLEVLNTLTLQLVGLVPLVVHSDINKCLYVCRSIIRINKKASKQASKKQIDRCASFITTVDFFSSFSSYYLLCLYDISSVQVYLLFPAMVINYSKPTLMGKHIHRYTSYFWQRWYIYVMLYAYRKRALTIALMWWVDLGWSSRETSLSTDILAVLRSITCVGQHPM